jgi:hypothetical protein
MCLQIITNLFTQALRNRADKSGMKKTNKTLLLVLILLLPSCVEEDACKKAADKGIKLSAKQQATCDAATDDEPVPDEPDREPSSDDEPIPVPVGDADLVGLSQYIANTVDDIQNRSELGKGRTLSSAFPVDSCHKDLQGMDQFSDAIAYSVSELSKGRQIQLQSLGSIFGYSTNPSTYKDVSLISHPLCDVTSSSLRHTIPGRTLPDSATIALSQRFANEHNTYRKQILDGDSRGTERIQKHWGKFFGCLAYVESLTTADTSTSNSVAANVAPSSYRKPAGVKFYIDPSQSQASKLNIGLFQFTPTYGGNINPCVKQWNKDYPSCKISDTSTTNMINAVGSARQHFNAYCGVHKIVQTFFVQSHTWSTSRNHPSNFPSGTLKSTGERCVTPHFKSAYNHFGPLQNTTGTNLKKLMSCIY